MRVMWPEFGSSRSPRWLLTLSSSGVRSVVPRKFVAGLVPALPLMLQGARDPDRLAGDSAVRVDDADGLAGRARAAHAPLQCRAVEIVQLVRVQVLHLHLRVDRERRSAGIHDRLQPRPAAVVLADDSRAVRVGRVRLTLNPGEDPGCRPVCSEHPDPGLAQALLPGAGVGDPVDSDPVSGFAAHGRSGP